MNEGGRNAEIQGNVLVRGPGARKSGSSAYDERVDSASQDTKLAKEIIKRQQRLEDERSYQDALWSMVDTYETARRAKFDIGSLTGVPDDQPAGTEIYDATTTASIRDFVDGWQSQWANPLVEWFRPVFRAAQLKKMYRAQKWLDKAKEVLETLMSTSNFYEQDNVALGDGVSHGISTMVGPEWHNGRKRFVVREYHPREVFIMTDATGEINGWHRKFMLTGRQILAEFGAEKFPEHTVKTFERNPFQKHPMIHAIFLRTERDVRSPLATQKPWASVYVYEEKKLLLREGGYEQIDLPVTWRWWGDEGYPYGTSPAIDALSDVTGLNTLFKGYLYAAQLSIRPPRLVSESLKGSVHMTPDGETYAKNAMDFVKPIDFPKQFQIGMEAIAELRAEVGERFKSRIFSLLSDMGGKMTAYQANLINGEKTAAMIPITTRATSQHWIPMINRFFHAAVRLGMIEPPPPEIMQYANSPVDIEMIGPMAVSAKRFLSQQPLSSFLALSEEINKVWPQVGMQLAEAINADELREFMTDGSGMPMKLFLTPEQLQAVRQMKMKLMQQQQQQQALGNMADAYNKATSAPEEGSLAQQAMGKQGGQP